MKRNILLILSLFICFTVFLIILGLWILEGYKNVERVIDGDTIVMINGDKVRVLGIDTPERGQEGFEEAKEFTKKFVMKGVKLVRGTKYDTDLYRRKLRYLEKGKKDLSVELLKECLAVPYGNHVRKSEYELVYAINCQ